MTRGTLTHTELDDLPAGSAVLRNNQEVFIAANYPHGTSRRLWGTMQSAGCFSSEWMAAGFVTLLWAPER